MLSFQLHSNHVKYPPLSQVSAHIAIASIVAKKSKQWVDISGKEGGNNGYDCTLRYCTPERQVAIIARLYARASDVCTYILVHTRKSVNTSINIHAIRKLFGMQAIRIVTEPRRTTCSTKMDLTFFLQL